MMKRAARGAKQKFFLGHIAIDGKPPIALIENASAAQERLTSINKLNKHPLTKESTMWQLHDDTKSGKGYLRIYKDGKRVADVFPFASETDESFVREQAARIVDQMNAVDMVRSPSAFLADDPPAQIPNGLRAPLDNRSTAEMMADRDGK